jgi:hypothetical protein
LREGEPLVEREGEGAGRRRRGGGERRRGARVVERVQVCNGVVLT